MLSISLDLGKVPSVLAALADQRNAQAVVNAAAEAFVDDVHDVINRGETLSGEKTFTPRHGGAGLEGAINWHGNGDGTATVLAQKDYAAYVEYGTGKHPISPSSGRSGLKTPVSDGRGYVLSKNKIHPGSKPHPFFFADLDNRQEHMQERALSVLAARMAQAGG